MTNDAESFNKDVRSWTSRVSSGLIGNVMAFSNKGNGDLASSIKPKTRKDYGEIDRITFSFARHGVFLQKGVGRGHMMAGNKVVRGVKWKKFPRLLPGSVNREPEDWFNGTMEQEVPALADIVADHKANEAAINAAGLNIK